MLLCALNYASMAQNVGISNNIFTPQSYLHVHQPNVSGNLFQMTNSTSGNASNAVGLVFSVDGASYTMRNYQNGFITFQTNASDITFSDGTERMRIQSGGRVGIGTATPHTSALLHVNANNRGILIPNVPLTATNAAGPVATPQTSLLVYNTATASAGATAVTPGFYYNAGTTAAPNWRRLMAGGSGADGWLTIGNYGTTPANNWIGTNDAQDFVFKTGGVAAGNERMRITSAGNVMVNITAPIDAGDAFTSVVSPTFPTAIATYGNGGFPIWAEQINIDADGIWAINSAAAGAGGGVGIFAYSGQSGGAGVWGDGGTSTRGIMGINNTAASPAVQAQNINAGGYALYAVNSAANGAGGGMAIYATSNQTGAPTIGATLRNTTIYTNTAISGVANFASANGVLGAAQINTGTGVRGLNTAANGTAIGFGGLFTSNQTGGAALAGSLRLASYFANSSVSGVTNDGIVGGIGVIGGCGNATGIGVQGQSSGTTASGVLGIVNQSGAIAVNGQNLNATGTGVVGSGNNQAPQTLVGGSGGAFTGSGFGVFGYSTGSGNDTWGGYFSNGGGASYAYVGGRTPLGTNRKIEGNGTVNTIVKDVNNNSVVMTCPETVEILLMDYGHGQLLNGEVYITIDPNLAKNIHVDDQHPLKVFVQLEGDCNGVFVTEKTAQGFKVKELGGGTSNVPFSYQIVAQRADEYDEFGNLVSKYVTPRWEPAMLPQELLTGIKYEMAVPQQLEEPQSMERQFENIEQTRDPKNIRKTKLD